MWYSPLWPIVSCPPEVCFLLGNLPGPHFPQYRPPLDLREVPGRLMCHHPRLVWCSCCGQWWAGRWGDCVTVRGRCSELLSSVSLSSCESTTLPFKLLAKGLWRPDKREACQDPGQIVTFSSFYCCPRRARRSLQTRKQSLRTACPLSSYRLVRIPLTAHLNEDLGDNRHHDDARSG